MKDTQVTVQDDATRATWTLPYCSDRTPCRQPRRASGANRQAAQRPTREDFRVGDRVSFEDRHLQTRIGTIVRINQKTASVDCENEPGWRVSFGLLRHVVDL